MIMVEEIIGEPCRSGYESMENLSKEFLLSEDYLSKGKDECNMKTKKRCLRRGPILLLG